jgi:hypothetical protein
MIDRVAGRIHFENERGELVVGGKKRIAFSVIYKAASETFLREN